jgi:hypothetical protein
MPLTIVKGIVASDQFRLKRAPAAL